MSSCRSGVYTEIQPAMRCAWAIALLSACSLWVVGAADRNFTIENDRFVKDGEVVQLISGRQASAA